MLRHLIIVCLLALFVHLKSQETTTPETITISDDDEDEFAGSQNLNDYTRFEQGSKNCRILINEVQPTKAGSQTSTVTQFVELTLKCGSRARQSKAKNLDGFVLLVVTINSVHVDHTPVTAITFLAYLKEQNLREIDEDGKNAKYFTIGSVPKINVPLDLTFDSPHVQLTSSSEDEFTGTIPEHGDDPVAIILLYFPWKDRKLIKNLQLNKNADGSIAAKHVDASLGKTIRKFTVDIFAYGQRCVGNQIGQLRRVIHNIPNTCEEFLVTERLVENQCDGVLEPSFSRCADHNAAFSNSDFSSRSQTPGSANDCKYKLKPLFSFLGQNLEKTAKKILLNVWNGITLSNQYPEILKGSSADVSARLVGVSRRTMYNIKKDWTEKQCLAGPSKKNMPLRKISAFDSFDKSSVRNILVSNFAKGKAITFGELFTEFMRVKEESRQEDIRLRSLNPELPELGEPFTCCAQTFRKFVNLLGYKYGKIDTRASIIQRPDIVRWRGRYLRRIRENFASQKPKKLIYLDETWIDVNGRTAKGWIPKHCERKRDMAQFTYGHQKVGKGPRLIVLSALEEEGIVPELIFVDKVFKSAVADDYHENVNNESFLGWFRRLIEYLNNKGDEYIIVMDNASYHTAKLAPKKSERKAVLYEWLKRFETSPGMNYVLKAIGDMRKWELEEILDRVVSMPGMQHHVYTIDNIAHQAGHEILRLPPYNCGLNPIEFAWKDIKHAVRKKNLRQDLNTIKTVVENELLHYSPEIVKNHFQHTRNLEAEYWKEDGVFEAMTINSIVISTGDDSDDDDDDDDDDSEWEEEEGVPSGLEQLSINHDPDLDESVDVDGEIRLVDCDPNDPVFAEENAILDVMMEGPPPKKRRRGPCV